MSFKSRLIIFGLFLAILAAIPGIVVLVQSPWNELRNLIKQSNQVLASAAAFLPKEDIHDMGSFALAMSIRVQQELNPFASAIDNLSVDNNLSIDPTLSTLHFLRDSPPVIAQAFNWYVLFGLIPNELELNAGILATGDESLKIDYAQFMKWLTFWRGEFEQRPGLLAKFRQHKLDLMSAAKASSDIGLEIANLYLMIDAGQHENGFFKENIAFVVESLPWWNSVYPGQAFNLVKTNTLNWRSSYDHHLGGKPGFHHSLISDSENWYLPRFEVDEWGTWFTVWYAPEPLLINEQLIYSTYNIDFSAAHITQMMVNIGTTLLLVASILLVVVVVFTHFLAARMAKPIAQIREGAQAVMRHDYDHRVPQSKQAEFATLIDVFNHMIQWVKQMTNLKEALSKLLSEELAELAANQGLVLGGQTAHCSIVFTDFAGFTDITQKMTPSDAVTKLNFYFSELIPIIKKWGGFPDKFIGDAIVVIFGAPVTVANHAERATRCAVEMQQKMREINALLRSSKKVCFEMRIGINTGNVMVGAIGCDMKLEYTSIGETTNLANRFETCCEIGQVLISEKTYVDLDKEDPIMMQFIGKPKQISVKGYANKLAAYPINIDAQQIAKNPGCVNPIDFYIVTERGADRGINAFDNLEVY